MRTALLFLLALAGVVAMTVILSWPSGAQNANSDGLPPVTITGPGVTQVSINSYTINGSAGTNSSGASNVFNGSFSYSPVSQTIGLSNSPTTGYPVTTNTYYTNTYLARINETVSLTNSAVAGSEAIFLFRSNGTPRIQFTNSFLAALGGDVVSDLMLGPGEYFSLTNITGQVNCKTNEVQIW